ncbi:DMT family transporter [Hoeflea sp. CAU 1731]
MSRAQANLLLLLAGAIWGAGFVAQSTAMDDIGPFLFIGLRFVLATLVCLPFAYMEAKRAPGKLDRSTITGFAWIGVVLFLGMASQQVGLLSTSVTNSGILTGLYVVFVPVLSVIFLRQRPHAVIWPASAVAFGGIWLLSSGSMTGLSGGDLLTILCAVFWAIQVTLIGYFGQSSGRPLALSSVQFAICAALSLAVAVAIEPVGVNAIVAAAPEVLYSGIFASGLAFSLQAVGQRYTRPAQAAICLSSEALFAALFGALLLSERFTTAGYFGCLLIFLAILAVEIVPLTRNRLMRDQAAD